MDEEVATNQEVVEVGVTTAEPVVGTTGSASVDASSGGLEGSGDVSTPSAPKDGISEVGGVISGDAGMPADMPAEADTSASAGEPLTETPKEANPKELPPSASLPEETPPDSNTQAEEMPPVSTQVSSSRNSILNLLEKAKFAIQSGKTKKLNKITALFLKKSQITNDDVEKLLHVSDATASRYLSILEKENRIQRNGKVGHAVFYTRK